VQNLNQQDVKQTPTVTATTGDFTTYEKIKQNLGPFLTMTKQDQRNILGNLLYPQIA